MKVWLLLLLVTLALYGCGAIDTPTPTMEPAETPSATPPSPPTSTPSPRPQAVLIARMGKGIPQMLSWSPDGNLLAVATSTGVYLYDSNSYTQTALVADGSWVTSIRFSADGALLAIGLNDGVVRVWDLRSNIFIRSLEGSRSGVSGLDFSPDGNLLGIGRLDSTLWLWDISTGQVVHRLRGHRDRVTGVSFGPAIPSGGYQLATTSRDGTLVVWNSASGQSMAYFDLHEGAVNRVAFRSGLQAGNGSPFVASASEDATIRYWDVETNAMQLLFLGATAGLRSLSFDTTGRVVAGGDSSGRVWFWDAETAQPLPSFEAASRAAIIDLAFRPSSLRLATLSDDASVKIWNIVIEDIRTSTTTPTLTLDGFAGSVNGISLSPRGELLGSAHADGSIRLWNLDTTQMVVVMGRHTGPASSVAFHPDGNLLVSSGNDGNLQLWSTLAAIESRTALLRQLSGHQNAVFQAAFNPQGNQIASVGADGTLRIWNPSIGALLQTPKNIPDWIYSLSYSPNGLWLADGTSRGELQIWQVDESSVEPLTIFSAHSGAVIRLVFSPDSSYLASSGDDAQIKLWETDTYSLTTAFLGHARRVNSLAFSHRGDYLASAGADGSIRIWSLDTFDSVLTIQESWPANVLVFGEQISTNIFLLISGSSDGTIRVWRIELP